MARSLIFARLGRIIRAHSRESSMFSLRACLSLSLVAIACLLWEAPAWAQGVATGSIAGIVKDASGGVLPGVTVEASSPALIEKSRTAVTDDQGAYKIVDLRPGVYAVTFSLAGF